MEELSDMSELPLLLEDVDIEEEIPSELVSEGVDELFPSEQPTKRAVATARARTHLFITICFFLL